MSAKNSIALLLLLLPCQLLLSVICTIEAETAAAAVKALHWWISIFLFRSLALHFHFYLPSISIINNSSSNSTLSIRSVNGVLCVLCCAVLPPSHLQSVSVCVCTVLYSDCKQSVQFLDTNKQQLCRGEGISQCVCVCDQETIRCRWWGWWCSANKYNCEMDELDRGERREDL